MQYWGLTTLQILGYLVLVVLGMYGLNKIGIFDCIKKCMPTKLCIHLLCCKSKTEPITNNQARIISSAPFNVYTGVPPIKTENDNITNEPKRDHFHRGILKHKKLGGPSSIQEAGIVESKNFPMTQPPITVTGHGPSIGTARELIVGIIRTQYDT